MNKTTLKYILAGFLSVVLTLSAQSHAQVPVIEIRGSQSGGVSVQPLAVSSQSELIQMVLQLQEDVRYLRGELETTQHKLNRLETDGFDRYRDLDRRISVLMQAAMDPDSPLSFSDPIDQPLVESPVQSTSQSPSQSSAENVPERIAQPTTAEPSSANDQGVYDEAFALVRAREFDAAITAFESFVRRYPAHANTANGYYWLGELHLAKESPELAKVAFESVLDRFPDHHKIPDTLYKLGVTFSRLGEHERSRHMIQRVINEYPQSSAATLAQSFRPIQRQ